MKKADNQLLVIFGASGDLTSRKLLPSLFELYVRGLLPDRFCILGAARTAYGDEEFRAEQHTHILEAQKGKTYDEGLIDDFLENVYYLAFDSTNADEYYKLRERIEFLQEKHDLPDKIIYYLATPPVMYEIVPQCLLESGLNKTESPDGFRRIIVEKPFGTSLESARQLNDHLRHIFHEEEIYRIDHYLGKETVQNILVLRFSNGIFEPLWNRNYIDSIEISASETLGVENRGKYYDGAGALRDMIQNHLLQILCMIAMSPPSDLSADSIRDEKVKVLKSLRRIDRSNVREKPVRGQYTAGFAQGKKVPGYLEEEGANKSSNTETFVAIRVDIDNWRWAGVPFYLRTGKRLPTKCSEVVVYFKTPELNLFKESWQDLPQNKLTIRLQPDEGVDIQVLNKVPGLDHKHNLQITKLDLSYSETFNQTHLADAYERLLLETMRGIQALFVRRDEVEEAWKWVDSITEAWAMDNDAPKPYQAGTWGPVASVAMITRDGRSWNEFE